MLPSTRQGKRRGGWRTAPAAPSAGYNVTGEHQVQERLRRPILVENLSSYLEFTERDYTEPQFFAELGRRSGCGVLLDVNNLMVNALNAAEPDPVQAVGDWIDELAQLAPPGLVGEIHLAGFSEQHGLIIDDHSSPVSSPVWQAYVHALDQFGAVPTLIEWDDRLPALPVLLGEAARAEVLCNPALRHSQRRDDQEHGGREQAIVRGRAAV